MRLQWARSRNALVHAGERPHATITPHARKLGIRFKFFCILRFRIWAVRGSFDSEIRCRGEVNEPVRPSVSPARERTRPKFGLHEVGANAINAR
jgi:hypothetical protein